MIFNNKIILYELYFVSLLLLLKNILLCDWVSCSMLSPAKQIIKLVSPSLFYVSCKIKLHLFIRALELAVKYKTHVDTVLAYREKYLKKCGKRETSKMFLQFSQGVGYSMLYQLFLRSLANIKMHYLIWLLGGFYIKDWQVLDLK